MNNPILAFSARRRMRSIRTPAMLTLYALALAVTAYALIYAPFLSPSIRLAEMGQGMWGYAAMVILQFGLLILIAPAATAGAISGERERQTLDLLRVTNTGVWHLVLGKLLESFGFLALLVLCSLPMLSLVLLTGAATFAQVLWGIAFLLVSALALLSVGIFCSALFQRTVTATVVSYLLVFGIGLVTLLPVFYDVKHIGKLYDAMNIAGQQLHEIAYVPVSFVLNPALGLFALLEDQLGLFGNMLWGVSYTLGNTANYLPFDKCALGCMLFMLGASAALTGLAVLCMRTRGAKPPKAKRKGKAN